MINGEAEISARAKDAVKSFTTRLQHQTDELKKEGSRVALVAIRKARESLTRWDSALAAWGHQNGTGQPENSAAASSPETPGASGHSPPS
jgi:hypothetical protein